MYAGLCAIYWSNGWLLIFEEEAQLQREPTWTACSWSSVWKSKRRWDLKIGVEALTQPNTMKSGSRPTFLKPGGIPHICHFFTQAILENKIYTKIYTVNCQFTNMRYAPRQQWNIAQKCATGNLSGCESNCWRRWALASITCLAKNQHEITTSLSFMMIFQIFLIFTLEQPHKTRDWQTLCLPVVIFRWNQILSVWKRGWRVKRNK